MAGRLISGLVVASLYEATAPPAAAVQTTMAWRLLDRPFGSGIQLTWPFAVDRWTCWEALTMDIVQTLETTVASRLTREALQFVVVPKRYFVNPRMLGEPDSLIPDLHPAKLQNFLPPTPLSAYFTP